MSCAPSTEYNEAIQNLRWCVSDPELNRGQPALNAIGLPMLCSGNFADVYKVHCEATGNTWAVKCFTRDVPGLGDRYREIGAHLAHARLPFMVDFHYVEPGIRIGSQWHPFLKMRWVEGINLNQYVAEYLDRPKALKALLDVWVRLSVRLREADLAHGDLQHGNVLLVPRGDQGQLSLTLIDYDGMYVPRLAEKKPGEVGHPAYQHPERLRDGTYDAEVDRFSHLAIYTAIYCLMRGQRRLWDRFDNGDNLLFRETDFRDPGASEIFQALWALPDADAHALVGHLIQAAGLPLGRVPLLDEVVGNGHIRPLDAFKEHQARAIMEQGAGRTRPTPRFTAQPADRPLSISVPTSSEGAAGGSISYPIQSLLASSLPRAKTPKTYTLSRPRRRRPALSFAALVVAGLAFPMLLLGYLVVSAIVPPERPAAPVAQTSSETETSPKSKENGAAPPDAGENSVVDAAHGPGISGANELAVTSGETATIPADAQPAERAPLPETQVPIRFSGHEGAVNCLAFSPTGELVSCGDDGTIRFWDCESGKETGVLQSPNGQVGCIRFLPNDMQFVALGGGQLHAGRFESCWVLLCSAETRRELRRYSSPRSAYLGGGGTLDLAPDGRKAYLGGDADAGVTVFNLVTMRPIDQYFGKVAHSHDLTAVGGPGFTVRAVAVTPDGNTAYFAVNDRTIRIWDLRRGSEVGRLADTLYDCATALAISTNGNLLLTAHRWGLPRIWDLTSRRQIRTLGDQSGATIAAFTPDNRYAVTSGSDGSVCFWDAATGTESHRIDIGESIASLAFTADGDRLAVGGALGTIHVCSGVPGADAPDASTVSRPAEQPANPPEPPQEITNSIGMKLKLIPAGEFMMGSPESEKNRDSDDEGPQHRVRITRPFYLGVYEVTQEQYEAVMGENPSHFKGARLPVETVSWNDAAEFCRRLSEKEGRIYQLPTEAEWEYACRAGTRTPFSFGSVLNGQQANCDGNYPYGTEEKGVYKQTTVAVGSYDANAWGLYHMHGNVWEWCADWYAKDYYAGSPVDDPRGPSSGSNRVNRGGSWLSYARGCQAASRINRAPEYRFINLGFRVSLVPAE